MQAFRDSTTFRGSITCALCLLLCLRIKHPVTGMPARLNTRPVASGYLGGIRPRQTARHWQAATSGCFRLERFAGWDLHPPESAAFHGAHPERTVPSGPEEIGGVGEGRSNGGERRLRRCCGGTSEECSILVESGIDEKFACRVHGPASLIRSLGNYALKKSAIVYK